MYVTKITSTVTLLLTSKGTEGLSANGYQKDGTALTTPPICTASGTNIHLHQHFNLAPGL